MKKIVLLAALFSLIITPALFAGGNPEKKVKTVLLEDEEDEEEEEYVKPEKKSSRKWFNFTLVLGGGGNCYQPYPQRRSYQMERRQMRRPIPYCPPGMMSASSGYRYQDRGYRSGNGNVLSLGRYGGTWQRDPNRFAQAGQMRRR